MEKFKVKFIVKKLSYIVMSKYTPKHSKNFIQLHLNYPVLMDSANSALSYLEMGFYAANKDQITCNKII